MDIIKNEIKKLDNKKKILLFVGTNKASFLLSKLLKEHFNNNLYCVLLNTIYIEEEDYSEIMYQYYYSDIKLISINCRDFFYRIYMFNNKDNLKDKIINYYNKIVNKYKEYIRCDIDYYSFSLTKENKEIQKKLNISNKISFEPFSHMSEIQINDISKIDIQLFTKNISGNFDFYNDKDYK